RAGHDTTVLATEYDEATVRAWQAGYPHPALGMVLPQNITICGPDDWSGALAETELIAVAVASPGLESVLSAAARSARPGTIWLLATKGWQVQTLLSPSEVAAVLLGGNARLVTLAGPAIAAEIVAGSPTALLCASRDAQARRHAAAVLSAPSTLVVTTSDVVGAETSSAFKNVVAIAVGIAEGLSQRFIESVYVREFANARAAMFAQGMVDMVRLAEAKGGHASTVVGLAGAGDLYVTCVGGRNGRFGRLLGAGASREQAMRTIGSTVEGVANTEVALGLASRFDIDLPTARTVDLALHEQLTDEQAMDRLRRLLRSTIRHSAHVAGFATEGEPTAEPTVESTAGAAPTGHRGEPATRTGQRVRT
ncbi:MAG TPA: NAD(P)H-dependent glycerol-3-phosphate dehydrogenase, partial [Micromonosporaceae bacterium]